MPWNGHLMSGAISIGDISQAVNNSSLDVGTLIAKGNIKKWALHKPVMLITGYDTPKDISDDTTWDTYMKNYVRSVSDNSVTAPYGLLVTPSLNIYEISGETPNAAVDWAYQQPPETGTFWRRMTDFNGYTDTPNVPMDPPENFTYYKNTDTPNRFRIVVYDGEAGSTSIPISELFDTTDLGDYHLMIAFKQASDTWYYTIMSDPISDAVSSGGGDIVYELPSSLTAPNGTYDGYICGINVATHGLYTDQWISTSDGMMRTGDLKIPLPLANKGTCKFRFTVAQDSPTNIVTFSYKFYINSSNIIQRIEFTGSKPGGIVNIDSFVLNAYGFILRDDNDQVISTLSDVVNLTNWDYVDGVSSDSLTLNVASRNLNAGDYPNFDESAMTVSAGSYTISIQHGGVEVV